MNRTITRFAVAAVVAATVALGLSVSAAHAGRPVLCRPLPVEKVAPGKLCPPGTAPGTGSTTTIPEVTTTSSSTTTTVVSDPAEAHLPEAEAPVAVVIVPTYTG